MIRGQRQRSSVVEIGPADAVLEDIAWLNDEFYICAVEDATFWFDRDTEDNDGDEARLLKVR